MLARGLTEVGDEELFGILGDRHLTRARFGFFVEQTKNGFRGKGLNHLSFGTLHCYRDRRRATSKALSQAGATDLDNQILSEVGDEAKHNCIHDHNHM